MALELILQRPDKGRRGLAEKGKTAKIVVAGRKADCLPCFVLATRASTSHHKPVTPRNNISSTQIHTLYDGDIDLCAMKSAGHIDGLCWLCDSLIIYE